MRRRLRLLLMRFVLLCLDVEGQRRRCEALRAECEGLDIDRMVREHGDTAL